MNNLKPNTLKIYLLPYKFKYAGLISLIIGIVFAYIRFGMGLKLRMLNVKVFAFYSSYFETKYFRTIDNNLTEEAALFFLLLGLFFIAFSKENFENDLLMQIRLKSLISAVYLNTALTFASIFFIYGIPFIGFLVLNMFIMLVCYILFFRCFMFRYKNTVASVNENEK
jgi:hypothetical protein